jgi:antitoxin PrlF
MVSRVRITPKGQLPIPIDIRRRHAIEPGSQVELREEGDRLYVESPVAAVRRTAGMLGHQRRGKPPVTIEEMEEAAAQGWADAPIDAVSAESKADSSDESVTNEVPNVASWETNLGSSMMTSKGQITVPAEVRERHGFKPGERISFREVDGRVIVEPATAGVRRLHGILSDLWVGKPPVTLEEMDEAIAAGFADEPIEPR